MHLFPVKKFFPCFSQSVRVMYTFTALKVLKHYLQTIHLIKWMLCYVYIKFYIFLSIAMVCVRKWTLCFSVELRNKDYILLTKKVNCSNCSFGNVVRCTCILFQLNCQWKFRNLLFQIINVLWMYLMYKWCLLLFEYLSKCLWIMRLIVLKNHNRKVK